MKNHPYLSKEDIKYFSSYWNEYQKNNQIQFETFQEIINANKKIDKTVSQQILKDIKTALTKKYGDQPLNIKEHDYYNYIEKIKREQDQEKNANDPEMKKLFEALAGPEQDYVYKKKLSDAINVFELEINLNEFFAPVNNQEELNFNEFCALFKTGNELEDLAMKTFYSNMVGLDDENAQERRELNAIKFPVNYVPH